MSRSKRNVILSIIVRLGVSVIALALAAGLFLLLTRTAPKPEQSEGTSELRTVNVLEGGPSEVRRQWQGFATAVAMDEADVPARVGATVVEIEDGIAEGATVEAGQVLVRLDPSDFERRVALADQHIADLEAQLERLVVEERTWSERVELAEQDVTFARADLDRVLEAAARDAARQREVEAIRQALNRAIRDEITAREELDKISNRRASLRAQLEAQKINKRQAEQDLERTTIASPLTGRLEAVDVDLGENVAAGARVARVVSLGRIEVPIRVPSSARSQLTVGQPVTLRATGPIAAEWEASIARLSAVDDEQTRTMTVYAEVVQQPEDAAILVPGRFVEAWISSSTAEERWVLPRRALQGDRIQLVEDGRISSREVDVEYQFHGIVESLDFLPDRQWVVLSEPLPDGSMVVLSASRSLSDGLAVRPSPIRAEGLQSETRTTRLDGEDVP